MSNLSDPPPFKYDIAFYNIVIVMGFPEKFLWGVSASGFQFEMGDSAGKNVDPNTDWYVWVHDAQNIEKGLVSGDLPENGIDY